MAEKKNVLVAEVNIPVQEEEEARVSVYLPLNEDDMSGVKVDKYEHVTINGVTTLIRRGEHVDVTVPVYIQLRNKYSGI